MQWKMALGTALLAAIAAAADAPELKTIEQRYSYSLGFDLGSQLRRRSVTIDTGLFLKGLEGALSGSNALLTEDQVRASIAELQAEMKRKALLPGITPDEQLRAGRAFLAENQKKEGVVSLPSGLQYKVLNTGEGRKPTDSDTVVCHYRGTLVNGIEFDSSHRDGKPATFAVAGVIPGWREALKLMAVGSRYQLFIPSELAYGVQGAAPQIAPNSTLIFELELIAIQ